MERWRGYLAFGVSIVTLAIGASFFNSKESTAQQPSSTPTSTPTRIDPLTLPSYRMVEATEDGPVKVRYFCQDRDSWVELIFMPSRDRDGIGPYNFGISSSIAGLFSGDRSYQQFAAKWKIGDPPLELGKDVDQLLNFNLRTSYTPLKGNSTPTPDHLPGDTLYGAVLEVTGDGNSPLLTDKAASNSPIIKFQVQKC